MRLAVIVTLVVLVCAACSADQSTPTERSTPIEPPSTTTTITVAPATTVTTTNSPSQDVSSSAVRASLGCGTAQVEPGDYKKVNETNGASQNYWTVVPDSYSPDTPSPVYLFLAAGGGHADQNYAAWRPLIGDPVGLFVVADTHTGAQSKVETYDGLLEQIGSDYCIDLDHVHIIANSSSAGLGARLMCQMPETFASFADSLGSFRNLGSCEPTPKPLIAMTGDSDRASVGSSVTMWATINQCDPDPEAEDLGSGITRHTYQGCTADVVLYDFAGMGHQFAAAECTGPAGRYCAEYEDFDSFEVWEAFFAEHPLP